MTIYRHTWLLSDLSFFNFSETGTLSESRFYTKVMLDRVSSSKDCVDRQWVTLAGHSAEAFRRLAAGAPGAPTHGRRPR